MANIDNTAARSIGQTVGSTLKQVASYTPTGMIVNSLRKGEISPEAKHAGELAMKGLKHLQQTLEQQPNVELVKGVIEGMKK